MAPPAAAAPPVAGPSAAAAPPSSGLELLVEKVTGAVEQVKKLLKVELSIGGATVTFELDEQAVTLSRSFGQSLNVSIKAEAKPDLDVDKLLKGEPGGAKLKPALSFTLSVDGRLEASAMWEPTESKAGVGLWVDLTGSKCSKVGDAIKKALDAGGKLVAAGQKAEGASPMDVASLIAGVIKAAGDASDAQKECGRPSLKVGAELGVGSPFPTPSGPSPLPAPDPGVWGMLGLKFNF